MKCAVLFAFAAFAFLAQANAKSVFEIPSNAFDRGAIADSLREKLNAAKEKLDDMISKAQSALKDKLTEIKEKADKLIEQLKEKAHLIADKVFAAAQEILDKMDTKINATITEIQTKSHEPIEDITECMIMKDTFRQAAMALIANVSSCVNDKIEEGESYVMDIYDKTTLAFEKMKNITDEGDECVKDLSGISKVITALGCITKATAKGTLVVATTVPTVILDISNLLVEISTLQVTLPSCISNNAILTLAQEAEGVVVSVVKCIKEKHQESKSKGQSGNESNNEVVDKHPEVQHQPNFENESANN